MGKHILEHEHYTVKALEYLEDQESRNKSRVAQGARKKGRGSGKCRVEVLIALPRWSTGPGAAYVCYVFVALRNIQNDSAEGKEQGKRRGSFLVAGTAPMQTTRVAFACMHL